MSETIWSEREAARLDILRGLGANEEDALILLRYNDNLFKQPDADIVLPLEDEAFVAEWRRYAQVVQESGSICALEQFLLQLRFPIKEGISQTPAYLAATQQGKWVDESGSGKGLQLQAVDQCRVEVYPSLAGAIATITAEHRADFVHIVQALGKQNEPIPLPGSMGALMVAGYRNWSRIQQVMQSNDAASAARILRDRSSFQDRFIILCREPYSGISAGQIGLETERWRELSWMIRREHEVGHYFCKRVLGSMRNNVLDELLSDYCGMVQTIGRFRADWLLLFLGLEAYPAYRQGARFENYRGVPPMNDRQLELLQKLVYRAALVMEEFDCEIRDREMAGCGWPSAVMAFASLCLEEFAERDAIPRLRSAYAKALKQISYSTVREEVMQ